MDETSIVHDVYTILLAMSLDTNPMNWLSHITFFLIVVVIPAFSFSSMRKLRRFTEFGYMPDLTLNNLASALMLLLGALAVILVWHHQGEGLRSLGLSVPNGLAWLVSGLIVTAAFIVIRWAAGRIRDSESFRSNFIDSMDYVSAILPRNRRERNSFYLLSMSAGIGEEILFRGFIFAYLLHYMGIIPAVLVSSILFGLAHAYQGLKGIPQTGLIGLALVLIYLYTGSLLASMILHAAIDAGYGHLGWLALQQTSPSGHKQADTEI